MFFGRPFPLRSFVEMYYVYLVSAVGFGASIQAMCSSEHFVKAIERKGPLEP